MTKIHWLIWFREPANLEVNNTDASSTTNSFVSPSAVDFVSTNFERIEENGFPYCIGSYGVTVAGDTNNEYGHTIGAKTIKYVIRVIK